MYKKSRKNLAKDHRPKRCVVSVTATFDIYIKLKWYLNMDRVKKILSCSQAVNTFIKVYK